MATPGYLPFFRPAAENGGRKINLRRGPSPSEASPDAERK